MLHSPISRVSAGVAKCSKAVGTSCVFHLLLHQVLGKDLLPKGAPFLTSSACCEEAKSFLASFMLPERGFTFLATADRFKYFPPCRPFLLLFFFLQWSLWRVLHFLKCCSREQYLKSLAKKLWWKYSYRLLKLLQKCIMHAASCRERKVRKYI